MGVGTSCLSLKFCLLNHYQQSVWLEKIIETDGLKLPFTKVT